jgi:hypothetical protein
MQNNMVLKYIQVLKSFTSNQWMEDNNGLYTAEYFFVEIEK